MKKLLLFFVLLSPVLLHAQKVFYCIPGQGSDSRLFKNISIDSCEIVYIEYEIPEKGASMSSYARQLANQIDTTQKFSLVGVSLGGMLAVELSKITAPEEVILIASAKTKSELPKTYQFFQKLPIHLLLSGRFYKFWTILLQPLYEPMPKADQLLWREMMRGKDPVFMKRAVQCIVGWENEEYDEEQMLHIHGTKDKTLPIKHIVNPVLIDNGTHIMTLLKGEEISAIINDQLNRNQ